MILQEVQQYQIVEFYLSSPSLEVSWINVLVNKLSMLQLSGYDSTL